MIKEELDKLPNPWIRIGVRKNTSPYLCGDTELYVVDYSKNYHGRAENQRKGTHYDLGALSIDSENGYTIIVNG